ncbi:DUF3892 domain-containing protein [Bacillus massilinigeriensis]|uniref:DUF3892 domain-containing protein n=1 Tax=Bacillus massilionigeriensis TaxID=1805475 RepID=UPI00096B5AA4|nr:DUF3892 domain-containing protein [Bacillus massilionigeriensis]
MNQETIIGVIRNHLGQIISYQTSEGRIISYRKAVQEAEEGIIDGQYLNDSSYDLKSIYFD